LTETIWQCPECKRVASVPEWCARPICVHAWDGNTPEVWNGDDTDGEGRPIEWSPNERYRDPGPETWSGMERVYLTEPISSRP
jgi:hypothetical protein